MSISHATTLPSTSRRNRLIAWIAGGATAVALIVAIAVAVWPASEADKARDDGKQVGTAVHNLRTATTKGEADAAMADLRSAAADTRDHAGDAVGEQVDQQADALDAAYDGFVGTHTSNDAWDVDLYQAELNTALDDLESNAADFRDQGSDVQQAFYDGFQETVNG